MTPPQCHSRFDVDGSSVYELLLFAEFEFESCILFWRNRQNPAPRGAGIHVYLAVLSPTVGSSAVPEPTTITLLAGARSRLGDCETYCSFKVGCRRLLKTGTRSQEGYGRCRSRIGRSPPGCAGADCQTAGERGGAEVTVAPGLTGSAACCRILRCHPEPWRRSSCRARTLRGV